MSIAAYAVISVCGLLIRSCGSIGSAVGVSVTVIVFCRGVVICVIVVCLIGVGVAALHNV